MLFKNKYIFLVWILGVSIKSVALDDALQVSYSHSEDGRVTATDDIGLRARVMHDRIAFPVGMRKTYSGYWFVGAHAQQTLITFHGSNVGERRLYRLSMPIDYIHDPTSVSRWSFLGRIEPAHYTDERLWDRRASQIEYTARATFAYRSNLNWVGGFKSDRRLGVAKYYPLLGIEWQQTSRLFHHWVFPDWRSDLILRKRTKLYMHMRPEGGQWRFGKYSSHENMHYVNWAFGMGMRHNLKGPFAIKLEVGQNLYRKLVYNTGTTSLNDSSYWLMSLESRFGE